MIINVSVRKFDQQARTWSNDLDEYTIDYWSYDWGMEIERNGFIFFFDGCPENYMINLEEDSDNWITIDKIEFKQTECDLYRMLYHEIVGIDYDAPTFVLQDELEEYLLTTSNNSLSELFSALTYDQFVYDWAELYREAC